MSHWSTIISKHFVVALRGKDGDKQFRVIDFLLIDPTVQKLHN